MVDLAGPARPGGGRLEQGEVANVADEHRAARAQARTALSEHAAGTRAGKYWTTELRTTASKPPPAKSERSSARRWALDGFEPAAGRGDLGARSAIRPPRNRCRRSARSAARGAQEQAGPAADLEHGAWAETADAARPPRRATRPSRLPGRGCRRRCCSSPWCSGRCRPAGRRSRRCCCRRSCHRSTTSSSASPRHPAETAAAPSATM